MSLPLKLVTVLAWFPMMSSWDRTCYIRGLIHRIGRGVPNIVQHYFGKPHVPHDKFSNRMSQPLKIHITRYARKHCPCSKLFLCFITNKYRNVPKFSDRQVWANSADPDQTAPRGAVWSGSTLFAIPSASFGCVTLRKSHIVQVLGWLQQIFGCPKF